MSRKSVGELGSSLASASSRESFNLAHEKFLAEFDGWLSNYLKSKRDAARSVDPDLQALYNHLTDFSMRSGKRIRPFLVYWGARAVDESTLVDVLPIAAAAELLHVFALVHDDVMDQADLRRGLPTIHRLFHAWHGRQNWRGAAEQFGLSMAILVGDIALALSDSVIDGYLKDNAELSLVRQYWNTMREEVVQGQFLDVLASSRREPASEAQIWNILSLKSGKYTMERPLHLGAAAAGAPPYVFDLFTKYGIPIGRAFQIQDDILGLFGSQDIVGKPVDSDVKEGKSTLLVAYAYEHANPAQRAILKKVLGSADATTEEVDSVRQIICETGALDYAESRAGELAQEARQAIESSEIANSTKVVLLGLSEYILNRTH